MELQTGAQINNIYNNFEKNVTNMINKHIPVKHKYMENTQLSWMERDLRKAIYKKRCFIQSIENPRLQKIGKNIEKEEIT